MKPERIQAPAAAVIMGVSLRQVQAMAVRSEILAAAKLGSI